MRIKRLASIAIAALAGIACEGITCTLIGCNSGLIIEVNRTSTVLPAVVRVLSQGAQVATFTCEGAGTNTCWHQLANQTPATVTVEVTVGDSKTTVMASPQYITSQPNGSQCGPTCRQATVKVAA